MLSTILFEHCHRLGIIPPRLNLRSHGAIFLAMCNAIPLLGDMLNIFCQTVMERFICQFYIPPRVELHCKLHEKLHRVTGPLSPQNVEQYSALWILQPFASYCLALRKKQVLKSHNYT